MPSARSCATSQVWDLLERAHLVGERRQHAHGRLQVGCALAVPKPA